MTDNLGGILVAMLLVGPAVLVNATCRAFVLAALVTFGLPRVVQRKQSQTGRRG